MPAIRKGGIGPKVPWREDSGQVIVPKEIIAAEPTYGLIDFTTPVAWAYMLAGHRLRRTRDADDRVVYERIPEQGRGEPRAPPAPPAGGGPYVPFVSFNYDSDFIPDSVISKAYRSLLNYNISSGRLVFDNADPDDEHFRKWRTTACEYNIAGRDGGKYQVIKIARGFPIRERFKRLAHETTAADLFEGLPRYKGDHEEREDEIIAGTDVLAAKYITEALRRAAWQN